MSTIVFRFQKGIWDWPMIASWPGHLSKAMAILENTLFIWPCWRMVWNAYWKSCWIVSRMWCEMKDWSLFSNIINYRRKYTKTHINMFFFFVRQKILTLFSIEKLAESIVTSEVCAISNHQAKWKFISKTILVRRDGVEIIDWMRENRNL